MLRQGTSVVGLRWMSSPGHFQPMFNEFRPRQHHILLCYNTHTCLYSSGCFLCNVLCYCYHTLSCM